MVTTEPTNKTFTTEGPELGEQPLYTITHRPGERWLLLTIHGTDTTPDICMSLADEEIRELRDGLSAIIWNWK